ncbi:MAG: aminodeoxychorismate/anthranilate synthase component II [Pseudomonadota bacterium]
MILVIDNFDSFTYNLVQYLGKLGAEMKVVRNNELDLAGLKALAPERMVVSPGPRTPNEAGISVAAIKEFAGRVPILGVCLGHQSIGTAFGGEIVKARRLMHGKTSQISHDSRTIFSGLANPFTATRYHSLAVRRENLPPELEVSATAEDGEIMGLRHRRYTVEGVQFHPESVLTTVGLDLMRNFLALQGGIRS